MKILISGTAGFIGFHLAQRLLGEGHQVVGLDNVNDYYDVSLKYDRLKMTGITAASAAAYSIAARATVSSPGAEPLDFGVMYRSTNFPAYRFMRLDLEDRRAVMELFEREQFTHVAHLAAQAGVRYSIENPWAYIDANITAHLSILEACRHHPVQHLVYASSSSVYGNNTQMPLSTAHNVDHPISLYAATKKSNELMAHTYSHLYGIPSTGLRFFTVYGPWGRPDMALFLFTRAILEDRPIDVYNYGEMWRDFTYVDDITEGVYRVMQNPPAPADAETVEGSPSVSFSAPYRIYNIGNSSPVYLKDFIALLEEALGKKAIRNEMPMQPGDVPRTFSDVSDLEKDVGYRPSTPVKTGIERFVEWYAGYYRSRRH